MTKGLCGLAPITVCFPITAVRIKKYNYLEKDFSTIPTNRINSLFNDHTGNLWVATENGSMFL